VTPGSAAAGNPAGQNPPKTTRSAGISHLHSFRSIGTVLDKGARLQYISPPTHRLMSSIGGATARPLRSLGEGGSSASLAVALAKAGHQPASP
jgi:hypothetical protein